MFLGFMVKYISALRAEPSNLSSAKLIPWPKLIPSHPLSYKQQTDTPLCKDSSYCSFCHHCLWIKIFILKRHCGWLYDLHTEGTWEILFFNEYQPECINSCNCSPALRSHKQSGITAIILQEILSCSEILSGGIRWWAVQADIFQLLSSISKICNWTPAKAKISYLTEGTDDVVAWINICYLKFSKAILHMTNITYLNTSKCFAESRPRRDSVGVRAETESAFKNHPNKLQLFLLRDCE